MSDEHGDPLADIVALLRPRAVVSASLEARGPWAIRLEAYPHVKFGTVVAGRCLIALTGRRRPLRCEAGDFFMLSDPPAYVMASALTAPQRAAGPLFAAAVDGRVRLGAPPAALTSHIVGGHFAFDPSNAHLLVAALPRMMRVPASEAGALRELTGLLAREVGERSPGRALVLDRLAQVILVQAMRQLGAADMRRRASWLRALSDPQIGAALRQIHADVRTRWTLDALAQAVGMSRSAFALRFTRLVGKPPLEYAIAWRMQLARDALRTGDRAVGELAFALGYASESAFSTAFRREEGESPRAFRQRARAEGAASEVG